MQRSHKAGEQVEQRNMEQGTTKAEGTREYGTRNNEGGRNKGIWNKEQRRRKECLEVDSASHQYPITNASTTLSTSAQLEPERLFGEIVPSIIHTPLSNPCISLSYCLTVLQHPWSPKPMNVNAIPFMARRRHSVAEAHERECNSFHGAKET